MTTKLKIALAAVAGVVAVHVIGLATGYGYFTGMIVMMLLFSAAYFIPTFIAVQRHCKLEAPVAVVNTLLGWTFIGWVVALAMAVAGDEGASLPVPDNRIH